MATRAKRKHPNKPFISRLTRRVKQAIVQIDDIPPDETLETYLYRYKKYGIVIQQSQYTRPPSVQFILKLAEPGDYLVTKNSFTRINL